MFKKFVLIVLIFCLGACRQQQKKSPEFTNEDISRVITRMTDIMVHDITNPPLAARFFSYACLAGYEVVSQNNSGSHGMYGVLNDYPDLKKTDSISGYAYQLSALLAMMETAKRLQPSGKMMEQYEMKFLDSCKRNGVDENVLERSKAYAVAVSKKMLAYAKEDRYNRISNYARYTPSNKEGCWYPTPPAYMAAVEPNFNTVRPFTLDSCSQFKPALPVPFSRDKNSVFYKLMLKNYMDTLTEEHRSIAAFWDCNPFAVQDKGHLMMSFKKISPGAHWLGITGIACKQTHKSFEESMRIYATVAIGLMDAFICCWDEKYRSNRIRPETAIRKYIDAGWEPLLQTPPFPEYLSGHSVVSSCSSFILSHFFGSHFSFTDSVELSYGLPPRKFSSFEQAAQEAAISRFYGGIHFIDAIENGLVQGNKVGEQVLQRLKKDNHLSMHIPN